MIRIPTHRQPTHPGEMLKEEFLEPMGISQRQLADALGVPYQRINEIVNGRRGITPSTALRLAKYWQVSPFPHSCLLSPFFYFSLFTFSFETAFCLLTHPTDTDIPLPANVKKTLQ